MSDVVYQTISSLRRMDSSKSSSSDNSTSSSTEMSAKSFLVVAAIDFGTAYSGYAFALKNDPTKIETNVWKGKGLLSHKTTTSILFEKDKFHSFGMKADETYHDILEEQEEGNEIELKNWHYVRRFKMQLYREFNQLGLDEPTGRPRRKISKEMKLKDDLGNQMKAFEIFSTAIKHLRECLLTAIKKGIDKISDEDVSWVLTVPAIWTDAAKQFMREAAIQAGIPGDHLMLALEPEAAAIHCKQAVVQKTDDFDEHALSTFLPGQEFLVLDMGGGTIDITISKVLKDGKLKEIRAASGGPWGGTKVDEGYFRFLKDLVTKDVWQEFSHQNPSDRFELECDFEIKKRNLENCSEYITIKWPLSLNEKYVEKYGSTLSDDIKRDKYKETVKIFKDKLKIKTEFLLNLFEEPKNHIIHHLETIFQDTSLSTVNTILMVGGFSESEYMQSEIKKHFKNKRVLIPPEPGLAVLKGAVIYGFDPMVVSERRSPMTYGISENVPFDEQKHDVKHKSVYDGVVKCEDIFRTMVSLKQPLIIGQTVFELDCRPTKANDKFATVEIYASTKEKPMYTSDPTCYKVGELTLHIPNVTKGKDRLIKVKMYFGNTEIYVSAHEDGTSNSVKAKFNCLSK